MKELDEFDGLAGYRWSALITPRGDLRLSSKAPADSPKKIAFIKHLLDKAEQPPESADLIFEKGKVMVRHGGFGLLLLFCEAAMNPSMLGFVLADLEKPATSKDPSTGSSHESSSANLIQTITEEVGQVPAEVIAQLIEIYTQFLGPLAPKLAKKDAEKNGLNLAQLPIAKWAALLNSLAARISDPTKKDAFLDRAVMLKAQF